MPPPLSKRVVASVVEPAVIDGPKSFFRTRVQLALGVYLKDRDGSRNAQDQVVEFSELQYMEKDVVGSYYGSLAYPNLVKKSEVTKRYKKKYMKLTAKLPRR